MTKKLLLTTFFLAFFHPAYAQLEYSLAPEKREILERDFERLCQLDFDAEFEFGDNEKWESVLKRAFGMERIDCLAFKKFIEDRVGLVVDHFQMENLVTINSDEVVERKEDWNFLFRANVKRSTKVLYTHLEDLDNVNATHLTSSLSSLFIHDESLYGLSWFLSNGMRRRNYIFALEYLTNSGEKKVFPISLEDESVPGVIFLADNIFSDLYVSFERIGTLIHEARHDSNEFDHVPCLNGSTEDCDNIPDGAFGLSTLFLAYIAGICGDNCFEVEKDLLINIALFRFQRINLYYGDNGRKIHPLLQRQFKDRQLSLDVYDLIVSLEEEKRRRDEGLNENWVNNWDEIIKIVGEKEHP